MKHIITLTGIRPDFIRMSNVFKRLDRSFKHTLIHTGQHFDYNLSDVFFKDLNIRMPDYNWGIGSTAGNHFDQLAALSLKIKENEDLIRSADLVIFLGDSNSVLASMLIKKLGVKVAHIEAGMRSGDQRMFEEINRKICDHCSDFLFVYHPNYAENLIREGIYSNVYTVGNTILEVVEDTFEETLYRVPKESTHILVDIHRPENFQDPERLSNIIEYAKYFGNSRNKPVYLLQFNRMIDKLKEFDISLGDIEVIPQMGFVEYLDKAYHSDLVISDSGTAQEELAILKTPLLVPRDVTERPESYRHGCSIALNVTQFRISQAAFALAELQNLIFDISWLGDGNTSRKIVKILQERL